MRRFARRGPHVMSLTSILGYGAFVFASLIAMIARLRPRTSAAPRIQPDEADAAKPRAPIPLDDKLAGVPMKVLLSDRSGPGAVLRDTLLTRPSRFD
jgi:hypothetical protein